MQHSSASARRGDAIASPGSILPVLHWDGRSPVALIGRVETRLAAGARFVVLSTSSPLGCGADRAFLEGWWRAARSRLDGRCAGWAVLVPRAGSDVAEAVPDFADFPIRLCSDRADALWWLNSRLAGGRTVPPRSLQ